MRQSALALVMATASSSCTICFILRQSKKVLFAASRQEANSGFGKDNRMSCHARTSGDSSGDNGVLGGRDPIAGPEQIGHIIAIVLLRSSTGFMLREAVLLHRLLLNIGRREANFVADYLAGRGSAFLLHGTEAAAASQGITEHDIDPPYDLLFAT